MADWDDVRRTAMALPEVTEGTRWNRPTWFTGKNGFAWERPLSKTDARQVKELGEEIPTGELLALRIEAVELRDAIIGERPDLLFTIPHFASYPAMLLHLDDVSLDDLGEILEEAWLVCASKELADAYLAERAD